MTDIQNLKRALETDSAFEREFTPEVCAALIQRIEELEPNAARYLWLRKDDEGIEFRDGEGTWRSDCPSGKDLDATIDAAIAAQSTKEQG